MTLDWTCVPPQSWTTLAPYLHAWNRRPDGSVRCLHAEQGPDVAAHRAELATLDAQGAAFWLCRDGAEPVGVLGCEVDHAAGRAWLRGPLVARPALLLDALNGPLTMSLLQTTLPQIRQWDAFPSADDAPLHAWYAAAGFVPQQLHRVLRAPAAGLAAHVPAASVRVATARDAVAAWSLHSALFPSSYLSADAFRGGTPQRTLLVLVADSGAVAGYLHAEDRPLDNEWYVDYLGVAQAQRGRGGATALLQRAGRCAAKRARAHVTLTVREDRGSAIGLYARCGFVELSAGRHWQRTLP